jgi:autotransporter-associated beta strand protein
MRIGLTTAAMLLVAITCVLGTPRAADAANATWSGVSDALWATLGNWGAAASVPAAGETATFNATSSNTTVDVGTGLNVGSVVFDTASAAAYTIGSGGAGSQTLTLGTGVTLNAGVAATQLFSANVLLGTATAGTYTFTNNGSGTLTLSGTVQGGTGGTAGAKTLNVGGTGATNFTNVVGAGGGTSLSFANTGSGTVTLSGAVSSSLNTLRATAGGWAIVDGHTITVASSSSYGGSSATGKFELRSGSVAFNGGLTMSTGVSDGSLFKVSGGSFTASSVTLYKTWGNSTATATTPASTTTGFVVTGGTATISGALDLAGTNSNVSGLVSNGSLTVNGETRVGNSTLSTGRWFVFQVSGGSFTSTDATNGIVLARSTGGNANNGALLLTGGTTTAEKISFGVTTTASGASGVVTLNGANASLYLGSGGIVRSATNTYTSTITLTSGLVGAKAGWSSSLDISLNGSGTAVTFRAADAAGAANNITLSGSLSGAGGFAKTGDGTLTLSGANSFTGAMAVTAGTLAVGSATALGSGTNALTVDGGTVNLGGYAVSIGQLAGGGGTISSSVAGASLATAVATSSTFAGTLGDGAGTLAFTKSGVGTLTLTGSQSYTGSTTISAGTLAFAAAVDQTLASAIGGAGNVTQAGSGRLALAAVNSYTGLTTVSAGTLALTGAGALASTGTVSLTGSTAVFDISGASGSRTAGLLTGAAGSSLLLGSNGLTVGNATNGTFNGFITGAGVVTKVGAGTLTLTGSNSGFTGGMVLAGGTVTLGGSANTAIGTGPVAFQGGVLSSNGAGGADPGGGGYGFTNNFIVAAGQVGTLNLPFRGTISGSLTGSGTFNVNVHGIRDDFTGNWSAFAGQLTIGTMTGSGDFRIAANIGGLGSAAVNLAAGVNMYQTYNPPSTGSLETVQAIGELSGGGSLGGSPVNGRFVNWSVGGLNTSSTFAGRITNSTGAARLTKVGSGTLTLSGSNSYTGSTTVSAGVLRLGDGGTTGLLGATAIAVSNGAVLAFNRSDDYGGAFANVISGSGGVRLDSGSLTLSASNTYTGTTSVLAGSTLAVNGRLANSTLNVAAGATLMGSGTIAGLTTVAGIHSPGNSPGIETFTNLTYTNGASVNWELWDNTTLNSPLAYDQIMVTGSLSFAGSTALNLVFTGSSGPSSVSSVDWNNAFWDASREWLAYSVSGTTTGFSSLSLTTANWLDANGSAFQTARPTSSFALEQRANNVYVVYAIVPEPAGVVLACLGGLCLAWAAQRSRCAASERSR